MRYGFKLCFVFAYQSTIECHAFLFTSNFLFCFQLFCYDMHRYVLLFVCLIGIYPAWCSLNFLNLWFHVINFGKLSTIISSNISSIHVPPSSFWHSNNAYKQFEFIPQFLDILVVVFCACYSFVSVWVISTDISSSLLTLSLAMSSLPRLHTGQSSALLCLRSVGARFQIPLMTKCSDWGLVSQCVSHYLFHPQLSLFPLYCTTERACILQLSHRRPTVSFTSCLFMLWRGWGRSGILWCSL